MALSHSPQIATNGLVFCYDMGNPKKSWKGAPTTNLYADGDFSSQALHPVRSGTWAIVDDPRNTARKVLKATPSASNQYHGRDIPVVVSTAYSLQMEVYVSGDFNGTSVQMYPEQGGGGANVSYNLSNKGTWQTLRFDGKAATTTNIRMLAYVLSSFTSGYVLISNVQVELGAFATPPVNGTRSNTQAVVDLTNNNTLTADSLTYSSDGTFSFVGVGGSGVAGNYISCGNASAINFGTGNFSLSFISYRTADGYQSGSYVSKGDGTGLGFDFRDGSFYVHGSTGLIASMTFNQTYNIWQQHDFVFDRSSSPYIKYYLNGTLTSSSSVNNSGNIAASINTSRTLDIGRSQAGGINRYFNGKMPIVKIYNRALSAAEVQQNFNAIRGRYGI